MDGCGSNQCVTECNHSGNVDRLNNKAGSQYQTRGMTGNSCASFHRANTTLVTSNNRTNHSQPAGVTWVEGYRIAAGERNRVVIVDGQI